MYIKGILSVDLFTFSKNLTNAILLFNDNIALMQIYRNVFTTCINITLCELLVYFFQLLHKQTTQHNHILLYWQALMLIDPHATYDGSLARQNFQNNNIVLRSS